MLNLHVAWEWCVENQLPIYIACNIMGLPIVERHQPLLRVAVCIQQEAGPNLPRDTHHDLCLERVVLETDTLKKVDQNIKSRL